MIVVEGKARAHLLPVQQRQPGAMKALLPDDIDDSSLLDSMSENELLRFE